MRSLTWFTDLNQGRIYLKYIVIGLTCTLSVSSHTAKADAYLQSKAIVPPNKLLTSPGEVDMASGRYVHEDTDLNSANTTSQRMVLKRLIPVGAPGHANSFANLTSSFDIFITERKFDSTKPDPNYPGNDYRLGVRFGSLTSTFDALAAQYGDYAAAVPTSKEAIEKLVYSSTLSDPGNRYTYTGPDGTIMVFRPIGSGDCSNAERCAYVDYIDEPNGTRLNFTYGTNPSGAFGSTVLLSVSSTDGKQINFEQTSISGQTVITKACLINRAAQYALTTQGCTGLAVPTVSYGYTYFANRLFLTSVTDILGNILRTSLSYDSNNNVTESFIKPGASTAWLTNTIAQYENEENVSEDIVTLQQFSTGERYNYVHTPQIFGSASSVPIRGGSYTDANSGKVDIIYDRPKDPYPPAGSGPPGFSTGGSGGGTLTTYLQLTPGPVKITDQLGNTTLYNYCDRAVAQSDPTKCLVTVLQDFTEPNGRKTEIYYAGSGLISDFKEYDPQGILPIRTTHREYGCNYPKCQDKATLIIDPRGGEIDYTYSGDHGGVLSQMSPAPTAGGARPLKLWTYVQRYAWVKNSSGALVQESKPIWVKSSETECQTVAGSNPAAVCDASAPKRVTTYEYGANGTGESLLVHGIAVTADGVTRRTCYSYDEWGNRISETSPMAGLSVCP